MDKQDKYGPWLKVWSSANEVQKRQIAAVKALELGWGGITTVESFTGMSHTTIRKGIRRIGGGRKKIEIKDQKVIEDLEKIMDKNTAGDPMSLLKWTNKSTYKISEELKELGYDICPNTVGRLLKEQDYSLQANVKTIEGSSSPERDEQFKYINKQVKKFIKLGEPVISVDTKKRERVGNFKNNGRTWRKKRTAKRGQCKFTILTQRVY